MVVRLFPSREIMKDALNHKVKWTMFTYAEAMMLALDVALMVYGCV